jgi:hypothetical protein
MKRIFLSVFFFLFCSSVSAAEFLPAALPTPAFCLNQKEPITWLRFLSVNGKDTDIGQIGIKAGLLGFGDFRINTTALIRIYMLPTGPKFAVDRFLAGLGVGIEARLKPWLFASFSPLYHESAHLGDGYQGNIMADAQVISHESAQIKLCFALKNFQVPIQCDIVWHTVTPQFHYFAGAGFQYEFPVIVRDQLSVSFILAAWGQLVNVDTSLHPGYEASLGFLLKNHDRRFRVMFYWEDQYGSGQDWNVKQQGLGCEIGF